MDNMLKELQDRIGYHFQDDKLLKKAMVHSSYANEKHLPKYECNERLEFLGDAVLELISSEFLFSLHKTMPEGQLTKTRASMVCEPALAFCARDIELGKYLLLGKGEDATGGRKRESVTSDAMEALIGAIYLDGGFANAKEFIERFILKDLENKKLARLSCRRLYSQTLRNLCPMSCLEKKDRIIIKCLKWLSESVTPDMESAPGAQRKQRSRRLLTRVYWHFGKRTLSR